MYLGEKFEPLKWNGLGLGGGWVGVSKNCCAVVFDFGEGVMMFFGMEWERRIEKPCMAARNNWLTIQLQFSQEFVVLVKCPGKNYPETITFKGSE